jgi:hypothetical protein
MIPKRARLHQPNLVDIIKRYLSLDKISVKVYMILMRTEMALWEALNEQPQALAAGRAGAVSQVGAGRRAI